MIGLPLWQLVMALAERWPWMPCLQKRLKLLAPLTGAICRRTCVDCSLQQALTPFMDAEAFAGGSRCLAQQ